MTRATNVEKVVRRRSSVRRLVLATSLAAVVSIGLGAPAAQAVEFGVQSSDVVFSNQDGTPATQAGSHPYAMTTSFALNYAGTERPYDIEELKDATFEQVAGLVGDATAMPQCPLANFTEVSPSFFGTAGTTCKDDTVVGVVNVVAFAPGSGRLQPVFSLPPAPGQAALLGFNYLGTRVTIGIGVKDGGDFNVLGRLRNASQALKVFSSKLTLWGDPSDPAHDQERNECLAPFGGSFGSCPVPRLPKPFLTLPRACNGPLTSTMTANGWSNPGNVVTATSVTHDNATPANPIGFTGCSRLDFSPTVDAGPTSSQADSPAGFDFGVDVDDEGLTNPNGIAQSDLKKAVVTLPEGMTVNPSSANGLGACSPAELARETATSAPGAGCPSAAKIGTVSIATPLLTNKVEGSIYLATQGDNPFGNLLAGYIVARSAADGIVFKLPGRIDPDPVTGRLRATFDNNPQLPFSHLDVTFKSGPYAPLVTPATCGTYDISTELTPWADPSSTVSRTSTFAVDGAPGGGACVAGGLPFSPQLTAGVVRAAAGGSSPFVLKVTRADGEREIKALTVGLPEGLTGKLAGVAQCSEAAINGIATAIGRGAGEVAGPSCPAGSLLGSAAVGTGAGPDPFFVRTGKVYLAGPYKGAPFSLAIVTPAVAGPFDLGNVVVRAGLHVDPTDAHVTVKTDPLPTILAGIPLKIREIRTAIDRPGFMLNPTSCAPKAIDGGVVSIADQAVARLVPFQAGECAALDLKPSLALSLSGKGQTTDGKHPAVRANLTQKPGQANLKKVRVALPLSLALDPDNANGLCEFADGSKVEPTCPKASIVGTATAVTPILDEPLSGPVYFVKNVRKDPKSGREIRTLPKLVIPLTGQNGVRLNLTGTSAVEDDQLVTTFDNIPDAPVSSFTLNINGGKGGILVVSGDKADICKSTQLADQQVDGQNGKQADADVYIQTPSCPLRVLSKKVGKRSVAVKVGGLGAGKVTVTGKGIKKTGKTIAKSTVVTITARRSKGKPGKVTVSFDPAGPAKARKTSK